MPLYTAILASFLLEDEPLRARTIARRALALAGLSLAFAESLELGSEERAALGATAVLLSPLGAALGNIALKRRAGQLDAIVLNGWGMLIGGGLLLALSALTEDWGDAVWSAKALGSILYLAVVGSAVAFVTLTVLLREMSAQASSFIALMIPFGALTFGAVLYGEAITVQAVAGAALVVAGPDRGARGTRTRTRSPSRVSALTDQLDYLESSSGFYRERIRGRRELAGSPSPPRTSCARASCASRRSASTCAPTPRTSSASTSPPAPPASRSRSDSPNRTTRPTRTSAARRSRSPASSPPTRRPLPQLRPLRRRHRRPHGARGLRRDRRPRRRRAVQAAARPHPPARHHRHLRDALLPRLPRRGPASRDSTPPPSASATSSPRASRAPGCRRPRRDRARLGRHVTDTFGMSDVWSTMAGECGEGDGLHLTTGDHALLEVIDPATAEPLPLDRRRHRRAGLDPPETAGLAAAALPLERPRRRLDRALCLRPHLPAHPHRRPPRRHAARRRSTSTRKRSASCRRRPPRDRRRRRPDRPAAARLRRRDRDREPPRGHPAHRRRRARACTWQPARGRAQDREDFRTARGDTLPDRRSDTTEESDERHRRRARHRPDHQLGQSAPPQRLGPRDDRRDRRRALRRRPRARRPLPRGPRRGRRLHRRRRPLRGRRGRRRRRSRPPSTSSSASPRSCSSRPFP